MKHETALQNQILLRYGREPDVTLFRQNVGMAKESAVTREHLSRLLALLERDTREAASLIRALIREPDRYTAFGLCKGSSDIVGIVRVPVQRMLGDAIIARWLALEVKTATGRVSKEQQMFLDLVNRSGGVGRVVRSIEDAGAAIAEARLLAA